MKIAIAQINPTMAGLSSNQKKIQQWIKTAKKADLIVFPELSLTAYHPLDLLQKNFFLKQTMTALKKIHQSLPPGLSALIGLPYSKSGKPKVFNSAVLLKKNRPLRVFSKEILADFNIFDEKRYFATGSLRKNCFSYKKQNIQILICEEMWNFKKAGLLINKRPSLIISINASPFSLGKQEKRRKQALLWCKKFKTPFIFVNAVGGQEEIIFDGQSFALNNSGELAYEAGFCKEELICLESHKIISKKLNKKKPRETNNTFQQIHNALVFGLKEFVQKNGFKKVHLGLSGGVDSAVTAGLAVKALGNKNVNLFFMPGPFTSQLSEKGAKAIAKNLNISLKQQSIKELYNTFLNLKTFKTANTLVKENLQARLRAILLMAYANQNKESLLLGTANKSELALGYSTLYGDLSAGLLPIGDLFKTEVYKLAKLQPFIPQYVLERKPSAELRLNQWDEKDLMPYKKLDPILKSLIELNSTGFNNLQKKMFNNILLSEFKRKQAPPVLKVKEYSFDRGWRMPLSTFEFQKNQDVKL